MGNINRMVDIVVLVILTGLSVSDIRNKKVSRKVLTLWGILTVFWKIVDFYQISVFLEKMEQTNVENLVGICAGLDSIQGGEKFQVQRKRIAYTFKNNIRKVNTVRRYGGVNGNK